MIRKKPNWKRTERERPQPLLGSKPTNLFNMTEHVSPSNMLKSSGESEFYKSEPSVLFSGVSSGDMIDPNSAALAWLVFCWGEPALV